MASSHLQVNALLPVLWRACRSLQQERFWPDYSYARPLLFLARDVDRHTVSRLLPYGLRQLSTVRAIEVTGKPPLKLSSEQARPGELVSPRSQEADIAEVIKNLKCKLTDKRVDAAADLPKLVGFFLSLGLSKAAVENTLVKGPALLRSHTDEEIRPKVDLLVSHGVKLSDIASGMQRSPDFLRSKHFAGTVGCLLDLGVRPKKLGRLVATCPELLHRTEGNLLAKADFLRGPEVGLKDIGAVLERWPVILNKSIQALAEKVELFKGPEVGCADVLRIFQKYPQIVSKSRASLKTKLQHLKVLLPEANLGKLLSSQPNVLGFAQENTDSKVTCLRKMFEGHHDVEQLIEKNPQLLAYSVATMERNLSLFQKLFGEADGLRIVTRTPSLLSHSWVDSIQPKLDFLIEVIKLDMQEVVLFPGYLGYSLSTRIKPRTEIFLDAGYSFRSRKEEKGRKGEKVVTICQALVMSNDSFVKKFGPAALPDSTS